MSVENPLWGAPRIHGELLKLGFEVAQSTSERIGHWTRAEIELRIAISSPLKVKIGVRSPTERHPHLS
jgi:hypothetical protein